MASKLPRHGSEAGYKAEARTGNICDRCRTAHRMYNKQFTQKGKREGLKYARSAVIDHLAPASGAERKPGTFQAGQSRATPRAPDRPQRAAEETSAGEQAQGDGAGSGRLRELGDRLASLVMPQESREDYTDTDDVPDYIHASEPDPEPSDSDFGRVSDEEFVITAAGMAKIEENLGTYLSIVGMTAEMIDPYCGGVLAVNFDNMVSKWSKVVAHYRAAAKLFLDSKGGVIFTWIAALQATWPVLYALYEHHLAHTVVVKEGAFFRRRTTGQMMPDATMPPMRDNYEYAAT